MKTKTKIFYSFTTLTELGAIVAFLLSAGSFMLYGELQYNEKGAGLNYNFNEHFFNSSNVVVDHLLWFQRSMFFTEGNSLYNEYLYIEPISILLVVITVLACIVAQAHSANGTFAKIVLIFGKVWWYSFTTYYSFITAWWFYQIFHGTNFAVRI